MKYLILGLMAILTSITSLTYGAPTACHDKIEEVLEVYKEWDRPVKSYKIRNCSSSYDLYNQTNACLIILTIKNRELREMVILDTATEFYLERGLGNEEFENYRPSRKGSRKSGLLSFVKSEGSEGKDQYGFLKDMEYVTRADYNLGTKTLELKKWKVGFFSNKYSHDYTVQCQ